MIYLLTAPVHGPVNLTAPYPVTNAEFTKELGQALGRPTPWIVPGFRAARRPRRVRRGDPDGQRAVPTMLHESGFEFTPPDPAGGPGRRAGLTRIWLGASTLVQTRRRNVGIRLNWHRHLAE